MPFPKRKIIYGCESRGEAQSPYLSRWTLWQAKGGTRALYLHLFHRSDADEMHDHPWRFVSIILWRGYFEETPCPHCKGLGCKQPFGSALIDDVFWKIPVCYGSGRVSKRVWPGMILFRRPEHVHRVVLVDGKPALTLVLRGPYVRQWGFWVGRLGQTWQQWREYFQERGC